MKTNNLSKLKVLTIIFALLSLCNKGMAIDTAPSISPSADQYVIIDTSGKTLTLTASGGTCDTPPPGPCTWTKVGDIQYVWLYDSTTLTGSPGPGGSGASLTFNENTGGLTNVGVQAQQQWQDQNGNLATTNSPTSTNVYVVVQIPTTLTFISGAICVCGGAYTWNLTDQYGEAISNPGVELMESVNAQYTTFYTASGLAVLPTQYKTFVKVSQIGTDQNGNITDLPVGWSDPTQTLWALVSNTYQQTITGQMIADHTYTGITAPDNHFYPIPIYQYQVINFTSSVLSTDNTGKNTYTTTVDWVSPTAP